MRSFVAIPLPGHVREALAGVQAEAPLGRAVDEDNLHLTLAFLGEVRPDALAEAARALDDGVRAAPFEMRLRGLDCFGGRNPRVLHAPAQSDPPLLHLHERVRGALRTAGLELPRRRFRPHVTLLRFGHRLQADEQAALARYIAGLAAAVDFRIAVAGFGLYRSTLTPGGPRYTELASFALTEAT
ncbi:RNA 2',3'-cyclic phosphodiesterase [Rhodobacteraceae bacterium 2CG4]|uniref:RNA 2',3'-cyclic phosphodiesterase n=1 Tax=Halovulum marinum TaxID=2662447 RepID=A0A6L5YZ27_9RHOB|nr:RNA 2',3'-cyclic phosphodiesterase [Halovulum marinum]MSU88944.1 RNA 2',3'-cyclic phosphodiesterase [Halovulum marinum]